MSKKFVFFSDIWKELAEIFTHGRHANLSIILLLQNGFFRGNKSASLYGPTVMRNATDVVLFRSMIDKQSHLLIGQRVSRIKLSKG